ncbi:unnamed protein product, partial [Candidula unifasciata]
MSRHVKLNDSTKSQHAHTVVLTNGNLDDNFDLSDDDNLDNILDDSDVDDNFMDALGDFELKDFDRESLALLTSVMCGRDSPAYCVSDNENDEARELDAPKDLPPKGSQANEARKMLVLILMTRKQSLRKLEMRLKKG